MAWERGMDHNMRRIPVCGAWYLLKGDGVIRSNFGEGNLNNIVAFREKSRYGGKEQRWGGWLRGNPLQWFIFF